MSENVNIPDEDAVKQNQEVDLQKAEKDQNVDQKSSLNLHDQEKLGPKNIEHETKLSWESEDSTYVRECEDSKYSVDTCSMDPSLADGYSHLYKKGPSTGHEIQGNKAPSIISDVPSQSRNSNSKGCCCFPWGGN